ncbi:hypothetical protein ACLOJK_025687 [Asimina triloba]
MLHWGVAVDRRGEEASSDEEDQSSNGHRQQCMGAAATPTNDEAMVKKMTESDGDGVDQASRTSATMAATVVTLMDSQRNPCVVEIRLGQRSDDGFPSTMRGDSSALMKEEKRQVIAGWADCPWLRWRQWFGWVADFSTEADGILHYGKSICP